MISRRPFLVIALIGAFFGGIVGLYVQQTAPGSGYNLLPVYAGVAAFLCSAGFWWLFLDRTQKYSLKRGVLAGALAGSISHYLCWYLMILGSNICYWTTGGCVSSLGEPPIGPIEGLLGAAALSGFSLFILGWATVGVGMLAAGLLAVWLRKRRDVLSV